MVSTVIRYAAALVGAYAIAWTAAYIGIFVSRGDGLDFRYFVQYFVLAWTFRAFELPGFIWIFSIVIFVPLSVGAVALVRRKRYFSQSEFVPPSP
jgi:hypothetical protein